MRNTKIDQIRQRRPSGVVVSARMTPDVLARVELAARACGLSRAAYLAIAAAERAERDLDDVLPPPPRRHRRD
jgi:hypothetical protein